MKQLKDLSLRETIKLLEETRQQIPIFLKPWEPWVPLPDRVYYATPKRFDDFTMITAKRGE